jgi:DNA-binding transcriptional LysR family regulator
MRNGIDIELRQLRAFEVLLRERNLTRAAETLGVAQPALSKTLAKLRLYFGDPLFVRSANRMEPTTKALELAGSVRGLLDDAVMLRTRHRPFDSLE